MSPAPLRRPIEKGNIKKGICENHKYYNADTGETGDCPKCASREIQSVNIKRLSDFRCSQCGERLTIVKETFAWKKVLLYTIPALVIIGLVLIFMTKVTNNEVDFNDDDAEITVSVSPSTLTDTVGNKVTLVAEVIPTDSPVNWISSDNNIATVNDKGIVTLLTKGEVTITAVVNDSITSSSLITVIEKEKPKILGGAASISGNTITFHRRYKLDLHTFDGDILIIGKGDKIKEAKIENGRLKSGIYVSSYGEERYLSGLNTRIY